jgi:hypothetical protein
MSPAGSYPAGPGRALSVSCLGLVEPCSDTPPDPYLLFNHSDTRLIPGDTPVTEKRRPNLLPRVSGRHITDLRHTVSFGSKSGYEAPVNSYLTGASPILSGLHSRTGAGELSRSSRFAKHTLIQGGDLPCSVFRSSLLHSSARPPTLAQRAFTARATGRWRPPRSSRFAKHTLVFGSDCCLEVCFAYRSCTRRRRPSDARATGLHGSRNGRCVLLLAPVAAMFVGRRRLRRMVKPAVLQRHPIRGAGSQLLLQIGGTNIAS